MMDSKIREALDAVNVVIEYMDTELGTDKDHEVRPYVHDFRRSHLYTIRALLDQAGDAGNQAPIEGLDALKRDAYDWLNSQGRIGEIALLEGFIEHVFTSRYFALTLTPPDNQIPASVEDENADGSSVKPEEKHVADLRVRVFREARAVNFVVTSPNYPGLYLNHPDLPTALSQVTVAIHLLEQAGERYVHAPLDNQIPVSVIEQLETALDQTVRLIAAIIGVNKPAMLTEEVHIWMPRWQEALQALAPYRKERGS
jgi:hypothetical protein